RRGGRRAGADVRRDARRALGVHVAGRRVRALPHGGAAGDHRNVRVAQRTGRARHAARDGRRRAGELPGNRADFAHAPRTAVPPGGSAGVVGGARHTLRRARRAGRRHRDLGRARHTIIMATEDSFATEYTEHAEYGDAVKIARRYVIGGRVQGVGFRWFAHDAAAREGAHGWVRNLADGSVEVFVEGEVQSIQRLEAALRRGPASAQVETFETEEHAPSGRTTGFEIR